MVAPGEELQGRLCDVSDSNLTPDMTLADVLALKEKTGHSTVAVTDDGTRQRQAAGHRRPAATTASAA